MHKNVTMNPEKYQKLTQHSCCSMLKIEFFKAIRRNGYRPVPKGGTFPIETIMLVVRSLYPNLPQMRQNFHHGILMPLHDSMPSFMNFRRVLDLLEFKNPGISTFYRQSAVPWCLNFIPISCMGPRNSPKDTHVIFQPTLVHWSMCL